VPIKNRLKSIRHKHEMNQTEFAQMLGVLQNLYCRWENQKQQPSLESALNICHKLKIKMEDLVEYIPED